jgi:hypothetical protein
VHERAERGRVVGVGQPGGRPREHRPPDERPQQGQEAGEERERGEPARVDGQALAQEGEIEARVDREPAAHVHPHEDERHERGTDERRRRDGERVQDAGAPRARHGGPVRHAAKVAIARGGCARAGA